MKGRYFSVLTMFIVACVPIQQQKPRIIDIKQINSPALNEVVIAEIGKAMVEKGYEHQEKGVLLEKVPALKSGRMKSLKVGDVLPYVTTINNQDVYYNSDSEGIAINEKTGVAGYYTPAGIIRIPSSKPQIEYKFTTITKRTEAGFKRQFIYNGKSGSTIKFTYREFNGDMARPAFTQDLQYDLSESSTIGFRDLRIEVIKATNIDIEYKVINAFAG